MDIVGLDVYVPVERDCTTLTGYTELLSLGKPFAITEFGPGLPEESVQPYDWEKLIGCIRFAHPQTVYFMAWTGRFGLHNDWHLNVDSLFEDPWVVNRNEVAWRPESLPQSPIESSAYTNSPGA